MLVVLQAGYKTIGYSDGVTVADECRWHAKRLGFSRQDARERSAAITRVHQQLSAIQVQPCCTVGLVDSS